MKELINLTIRLENLKAIVSGEKIEEYREAKDYYFNLFKPLDNTSEVLNPCTSILFRCKNQNIDFWAIVECKKIVYEKFINFIPENFAKFDVAFTLYLGKVLKHNLD